MYNKDRPKYHEYRVIFGSCSVKTTTNRTFGDTRSIDLAWGGQGPEDLISKKHVWQGSLNNRSLLALRLGSR